MTISRRLADVLLVRRKASQPEICAVSIVMSRSTLAVICLSCLGVGLSVGSVEHARERGYSPTAAAISGLLSLTLVLFMIVTAVRRAEGEATAPTLRSPAP
jgi:hypothetical protein